MNDKKYTGTVLATIVIILIIIILAFVLGKNEPIPTPPVNQGNVEEKSSLIVVNSPTPGDTVSSPIEFSGQARGTWFFEGSFGVHIEDANGKILGSTPAQAEGEWMTTDFVPFSGTLSFETPTTDTGKMIFSKDNPSGLPEHDDMLWFPIKFDLSEKNIGIKVFFGKFGESDEECEKVFPVERTVHSSGVAREALEELFAGPTPVENTTYFSSIPDGVKINSIDIRNGIAYADFSQELENGVAGSCRVINIRSQIMKTLLQFPTIKGVVISINGRTEDILQP